MDTTTETKTVAGDKKKKLKHIELLPEDDRGLLTQMMAYLERNGFAEDTKYPAIMTHLVRNGANLLSPEDVRKSSYY